jgi:Tfp pilus assembly protein PilN
MRGINFIREREAGIAARRITCRGYAIRLATLLLIVFLGIVPLETMVSSARVRSRTAQKQVGALSSRIENERALRARLDIQCAQAARFAETRKRTQAWRHVMGEIAGALPEDVWVKGISSDVQGDEAALTLACQATSLTLATDFALGLKRSPVFSSAMLTATTRSGDGRDSSVQFDCLVRVAKGVLTRPATEASPKEGSK